MTDVNSSTGGVQISTVRLRPGYLRCYCSSGRYSGLNPEQCSTRTPSGELIPISVSDDPHSNGTVDVKAFKGAGQCCPHNNIVLNNLNFTKNLVFTNLYNIIPLFPGWSLLSDDLAKARHGFSGSRTPESSKTGGNCWQIFFCLFSYLVYYFVGKRAYTQHIIIMFIT